MNKKLVIFDFDGVLVNTMPLWYGINLKNNPNLTYEQFYEMSLGNFADSLENTQLVVPDDYYDQYDQGLRLTSIPEIIKNNIIELSKSYVLAIVSSGSEPVIRKCLQREGVESLFCDVLGFQTHRNKTAKLQKLLEKYNLENNEAVFITDTLGDIEEAHKAHVPTIAITWGLHKKETLLKGNPEKIIDDPRELISVVDDLLNR